jgi:hypothetical protein
MSGIRPRTDAESSTASAGCRTQTSLPPCDEGGEIMNTRLPINTDLELVAALGNVFDNIKEPETEEEVDAFLRETGHDPDVVGRGTCAFVDGLIRAARSDMAQRREEELASFGRRMAQIELPLTRVGLIEAIQAFVARRGPEMATQFRNFEQHTDEDLRELLTELMALEKSSDEEK